MEGINTPPPLPTSTILTPLLISMLGIVAASMALIVYHLVLVKFCMRRQENSGEAVLESVPETPPPSGVEDKILQTIPILSYSTKKGYLFRVDQTECVICLGELENEDIVRLLPNCKHSFHVPCIDQWFTAHDSCPVCRSPIVAPITQELPLHEYFDNGAEAPPQDHRERSPQTPRGVLRHCVSMALPREKGSSRNVVMGLKRSLSMDQSNHVVIDIQRESESECFSTKSELFRSRLYRARLGNWIECLPSC